jgi:hypothetical protein
MTDLHQRTTADGRLITDHGDPVDSWHDHSADERPMEAHGEVGNPGLVMAVGLGLFVLIVGAVIAVDTMYRGYAASSMAAAEVSSDAVGPVTELRAEKTRILAAQQGTSPIWVQLPPIDEKTPGVNVVQIPTADAARAVIAEYSKRLSVSNPPETSSTSAAK